MIRPLLLPGARSAFSPDPIGADGRTHADNLWTWARFFFERLALSIESARSLSHRCRLTRREKNDYLAWLEPVERLTHSLLLARAITWLTQTDAGRRLLAKTPKQPLPGPRPATFRKQQQQESNNATTAEQHPDCEARPLTRTPEEIEAAYLALPIRRQLTDDPATWICPFRILRFDRSHPPNEDGWRGAPTGLTNEDIANLDYIPHVRSGQSHGDNHGPSLWRRRRGFSPAALRLARRVEALSRVLANPARHIKHAARLIARLPHGTLQPPDPPRCWWMQGHDACRAAIKLVIPLLEDLNRAEVPEPG